MVVQTQFDIRSMKWSEPVQVRTKLGMRTLRKTSPTEDFWVAWRAEKEKLKAMGISCSKSKQNGLWEICHWTVDVAADKEREAAVEASRASDADISVPCPEGLAYLPYQRAGIFRALEIFGDLK